jgi:hypothetical protein
MQLHKKMVPSDRVLLVLRRRRRTREEEVAALSLDFRLVFDLVPFFVALRLLLLSLLLFELVWRFDDGDGDDNVTVDSDWIPASTLTRCDDDDN